MAGDLYEAAFHAGIARPTCAALGALAPMRVFITPGNHDPFAAVALPSDDCAGNVTLFDARSFSRSRLRTG